MRVFKTQNIRKHVIDKEILSLFLPFHYYHTFMCVRQYNIKDNYVARISKWNYLCGFLMSCFLICWYYAVITTLHFGLSRFTVVYHVVFTDYIANFFVLCFVNFYGSVSHLHLLKILQDISRFLLSGKDLKKLKTWSWGLVVTVIFCYVNFILVKFLTDLSLTFLRASFAILSIVLDVGLSQVIFSVFVVYYLFDKWNSHLEKINFNTNNDETALEIDAVITEMFNLLCSIKNAWKYTKKVSEFMVLCHFFSTFIQGLVYVLYFVIWMKTTFFSKNVGTINTHAFAVFSLLSKLAGLEIGLCICCELLYEEIARAHCNLVKRCPKDLTSKRMWKNMRRMIRNDFQKMSACGVFTVNAATMLSFSDVMTTYIIVALQFAYL